MAQQAKPSEATLIKPDERTLLERITITATRDERDLLDVPQTVNVITQKEIEQHVVRDIQDLVRYTPGVSVTRQTSQTNPFSQLTAFNIRGVGGNRVQLLVDGSRVQEITTDGSRDFVDPFNLKAVEIVRGPNSVLWGSDALGGVVNFRTRDPADLLVDAGKPWAVELRTAYDSFDDSFRQQVTGAAEFGDFQVLASFGHLGANEAELSRARADGGIWGCPRQAIWPCNKLFPADTEVWSALTKVVWTPNDQHTVKLTGELFERETTIDQPYDSGATYGPLTGPFSYNSDFFQRELDMTRYRFAVEHDWTVGSAFIDNVKWNVSYQPQRRLTHSNQLRTYANREQRNQQLRDYGEDFLEADVQLTSLAEFGGTSHTIIWGFDGDTTETNYDGFNTVFRSDTGETVVTGNQGFNFPQVTTTRADFYVQDEIKLLDDRLTVIPGLRYSTYKIDPTDDDDYVPLPGFEPRVIDKDKLTKKLGAVYDLTDNYKLYASYGEGFKMPTSQQLFVSINDPFSGTEVVPNPNLRPESVQSYEAGVRGEFDWGFFSVGGFYADYKDFIRSLQQINPNDPNRVTSDNVEDVKLYGIEVSAEAEVRPNFWLTAALSWQEGNQRVAAGEDETAFDGASPFTAVLGGRYLWEEWNLEAEVISTFAKGVSRRSDPEAFKPEAYAVFDAFLTWKPTKMFEVNAGVQNIFDTRYFPNTLTGYALTPASDAVANVNPLELQVAPGRTFKFGATMRF